MQKAKSGDSVQVHYTGKLQNGSVFDTSVRREPLELILGEGRVISGFEEALVGMVVGDRKTIQVPPEKAYGPHRQELVFEASRSSIPASIEPEVGQHLEYRQAEGPPVPLTVVDVTEDKVTLDSNHPLAGEELTFELELVGLSEGGK